MIKTPLRQKIFLAFLGILLSIVVLEGFLRLAGMAVTAIQQSQNKVRLQEDEFRILCIGESTTALGGENSYPSQLKEILNKKSLNKKFVVINEGKVSSTSDELLALLEGNLDKYRPHLVVIMMGINDGYRLIQKGAFRDDVNQFLSMFKTYKLMRFVWAHLKSRWNASRAHTIEIPDERSVDPNRLDKVELWESEEGREGEIADKLKKALAVTEIQYQKLAGISQKLPLSGKQKIDQQQRGLRVRQSLIFFRLGRYYRLRRDYRKAKEYCELSITSSPDRYWGYLELGRLYKDQEMYDRAIPIFRETIKHNNKSLLARMDLARCYTAVGKKKEAYDLFSSLFNVEIVDYWQYAEIAGWFKNNGYLKEAEDVYLKALEKNPGNYEYYEDLSQIYKEQGKIEKSRQILLKSQEREGRLELYSAFTMNNYREMVGKIRERGISVICMQYPLRSVERLKRTLKVGEDVVFIGNESNFKEALKTAEYSKYFSDNFASDFGHCRREGNRLIAENLADVIIRNILEGS